MNSTPFQRSQFYFAIFAAICLGWPQASRADNDARTVTTGRVDGDAAVSELSQANAQEVEGETEKSSSFTANYFGILYGPALSGTSSYQPNAQGKPDPSKPVMMKNFLTLGYNLSDHVNVSGAAYWIYQPVMGQQMVMQDPYVQVSHNQILNIGDFNLFGLFRVNLPVTTASRQQDMLTSFQTIQAMTYQVPESRLMFLLLGSERTNIYGRQGYGKDWELYAAPGMNYQLTPSLSATLLYEMQGSHYFGDPNMAWNNEGTDLQTGVTWDVTPSFWINPYLNLQPGGSVSLRSTSVGMLVSWTML